MGEPTRCQYGEVSEWDPRGFYVARCPKHPEIFSISMTGPLMVAYHYVQDEVMNEKPGIGRIQIWVDCICGAEIDFEDVATEGSIVQKCSACGRSVEISGLVEVQDISPSRFSP